MPRGPTIDNHTLAGLGPANALCGAIQCPSASGGIRNVSSGAVGVRDGERSCASNTKDADRRIDWVRNGRTIRGEFTLLVAHT
jgi:hypothetical protein